MADRCGNTIHSDYVTDHRCVKEREHAGDCWFGFGIPTLNYVGTRQTLIFNTGATPPGLGDNDALYRIVSAPYARPVAP